MYDLYAVTQQRQIVRNVMNCYSHRYLFSLSIYNSKSWRSATLPSLTPYVNDIWQRQSYDFLVREVTRVIWWLILPDSPTLNDIA